jgi:tRNA(Ile)-lysidine synthase
LPASPDPVADLLRRADLTGLAPPVVVGCSGGADSVALLLVAARAGLAPQAVHVDHGLRAASADDAAVVAASATACGVPWRSIVVDVAPGSNLEARARDARYEALRDAAAERGARWILVGHTADDQAETVLLHVLRGSAATGLAGMRSRRDDIARPFLGVRRANTHALCDALGLSVVVDPMNEDPAFTRSVLRHTVLPQLSALARRDLVPVLARQAAVLRAESDHLDELARAAWPGDGPPSARELAVLAPVVARRAVRMWVGPPPPSVAEVDRVLSVARGERRSAQLAGRREVRRSGGVLRLVRV